MHDGTDYIELVRRARLGDSKSLAALAERFRGRLYAYVYRIVVDRDLAQDVVQETMLQMLTVIGKLENAERFWPWLRAIAFNRIRRAYKEGKNRRSRAMANKSNGERRDSQEDGGLAKLVAEELRGAVVACIKELKPEQRRVLTMRCYEEMEYSEIGELTGCSELGARVRFCRAKRALQKRLSKKGFGKGFLVTALVVFGKLTAPSKAAAAGISVTSVTTKAGALAGLLALAGSKGAVITVVTGGMIGLGAMVMSNGPDGGRMEDIIGSMQAGQTVTRAEEGAEESWYYYPAGKDGPVMMRTVRWESSAAQSYCQLWQDGEADYYFDKRKNTIYVNNWRMCRDGLAVQRLPTDWAELRDFISTVEDSIDQMAYVSGDGKGLLVITRSEGLELSRARIVRHYNMMNEEYFKYKWPATATVVDRRDMMHKRGWTYFRISGQIGSEQVSGKGRIPFVYDAMEEHYPWLELRVGGKVRIVDCGSKAVVYNGHGQTMSGYQGQSFFQGLGRPWMGLHTIDTVRRDAAEQRVWFKTRRPDGEADKVQITLTHDATTLIYTIDLENDTIDEILIMVDNDVGGELKFSYLQMIDGAAEEFISPRRISPVESSGSRMEGLWLMKLVEDSW
ncbi:MAG: sigma-70 family RNA polymerase sigma factor [Sedimentisphaerales bacterium]|nr:sigma-70 family RNA polymerase sigma factor [Sedimentisphaerales bacterium]